MSVGRVPEAPITKYDRPLHWDSKLGMRVRQIRRAAASASTEQTSVQPIPMFFDPAYDVRPELQCDHHDCNHDCGKPSELFLLPHGGPAASDSAIHKKDSGIL